MSATQRVQQWATFARQWHLFDCKWQNPFESAEVLVQYLKGMHKPIYHPMNNCGDHVVCINTKQIALPGDEWTKRVYFHHTGYPGGASWTLAWELHSKDPCMIMKKAIYRGLGGNLQRRYTMQRLHLYPDDYVPRDILENVTNQIRQLRRVPVRLDEIDPEIVENYPKIFDYDENYLPKKIRTKREYRKELENKQA